MIVSKYRRGFTLVEIMIVIAIIGVLAGIMVPNYMKSRAEAQFTACSQNLKALYTAVEMYRIRHNITKSMTSSMEDALIDGGYIKEYPKCPGGGSYLVEVHPVGGDSSSSDGACIVICFGRAHVAAGCSNNAQIGFPRCINGQIIRNEQELMKAAGK